MSMQITRLQSLTGIAQCFLEISSQPSFRLGWRHAVHGPRHVLNTEKEPTHTSMPNSHAQFICIILLNNIHKQSHAIQRSQGKIRLLQLSKCLVHHHQAHSRRHCSTLSAPLAASHQRLCESSSMMAAVEENRAVHTTVLNWASELAPRPQI